MLKITLFVLGLLLQILGFLASNADKDSNYRNLMFPHHDKFIYSLRSLQAGTKVTPSDPTFWIYVRILQHANGELKNSSISQINALHCSPGLYTDGAYVSCNFEITLTDGDLKQVSVRDLQEKVDEYLLKNPAFNIAWLCFWLGVIFEFIAAILAYFDAKKDRFFKEAKVKSKRKKRA